MKILRDEWRDLVFWIAFAGAFMTTLLIIHGVANYIVRLVAYIFHLS